KVLPPAQFTVTPPTNYPPLPDLTAVINVEGRWGAGVCEDLKSANQAGIYLNSDLTVPASVTPPWDTFAYDGNRVFKEMAERLDGVTGGTWQANHNYVIGDLIVADGFTHVVYAPGKSGSTPPTFNQQPTGKTPDHGMTWINAGNAQYWTNCSAIIGMQYVNWAMNVARWHGTNEWNIFPWGMYLDFLRQ